MSYFTELQFLDLDDVSKEEAEEINDILFSTSSSRSVILPWVEDNVDWNQQSSYEGETSECSEGGGDCYQATGPPVVPVPTSIHQVYPQPTQVVPTVQLSYLQPAGYFQTPHRQVYDGPRRRGKTSPKRSGSGSSNVGSVSSNTVAQGSPTPGSNPGTTVAPPYTPLAPFPYHHPLVQPHPSAQYGYMGTGMGPAQHATGPPLFLTPQIPMYTPAPPPHLYSQYAPHQQVYSPGLHTTAPPAVPQDRSQKAEEPGGGGTGPAQTPPAPAVLQQPSTSLPTPPQPNDIDVGMVGGLPPVVHMVGMSQQSTVQPPLLAHTAAPAQGDAVVVPPGMAQHQAVPSLPPIPGTTTLISTDTEAKVVEVQESASRVSAPVNVPVQPKSLPPLNAIKTTSLPPSGAIKANQVKPGAVSMRKQQEDVVVVGPVIEVTSASVVVPSPVISHTPMLANPGVVVVPVATPLSPPVQPVAPLGAVQPQIATAGPIQSPAAPIQSATVPQSPPSLAPVSTQSPAAMTLTKPWTALFKSSSSSSTPVSSSPLPVPPSQQQGLPVITGNNPSIAESMLGGNKGPHKTLSKGPPPQNAVVLVPPPAHLVSPGVHHSGLHGSSQTSSQQHSEPKPNRVPPPGHSVAGSQDPTLLRMAEILSGYELEHRAEVLTPRGLNNPSNYCYINATLQALLACAPFYNLIKKLAQIKPPSNNSNDKSPTPVIDSMIQFVSEFSPAPATTRIRKERSEKAQARKEGGGVDQDPGILNGTSFEPIYVYKMVHSISSVLQLEGRQEDAEEFLTALLNGLNDEMIELLKLKGIGLSNGDVTTNGDSHGDMDNSDWKEMMNKGVSRVTRRTEVGRTPLTEIFMGQIRSRVERTSPQFSNIQSTDNIQPFYSLQLDVENCNTLEEALDKMTNEKAVEGSKAGEETTTASYIDHLPVILILHLKCFYYSQGRPTKISKSPVFPVDLKLEPKLLQPNKSKQNTRATLYKLFAVVYHEGKEATKGHYLADVYHIGSSTWIRYDDTQVKPVSEHQVLNPKPPRVPYLLLYKRIDRMNRS